MASFLHARLCFCPRLFVSLSIPLFPQTSAPLALTSLAFILYGSVFEFPISLRNSSEKVPRQTTQARDYPARAMG